VIGVPTVEALANGRKAVALPYSDYLSDLYATSLLTSTGYARDHPEKVKKFTAALLKGLGDAIDHPDQAGEILRKARARRGPGRGGRRDDADGAPYVRSAAAGPAVGRWSRYASNAASRSAGLRQITRAWSPSRWSAWTCCRRLKNAFPCGYETSSNCMPQGARK